MQTDVVGAELSKYVHPEDLELFRKQLKERQNVFHTINSSLVRPNGRVYSGCKFSTSFFFFFIWTFSNEIIFDRACISFYCVEDVGWLLIRVIAFQRQTIIYFFLQFIAYRYTLKSIKDERTFNFWNDLVCWSCRAISYYTNRIINWKEWITKILSQVPMPRFNGWS